MDSNEKATASANAKASGQSKSSARKGLLKMPGSKAEATSRLLSALILALCFFSCSSDSTYYSSFRTVEAPGWRKEQPLRFVLPDSLPAAVCDMEINVRHDNYYPYRNLWVRTDYVAGGKVVESYTVNVELADKFGNWHGAGLGKLFQYRVPIRRNVAVGKYDGIILWHYMRCDTVAGISDIGISISAASEE